MQRSISGRQGWGLYVSLSSGQVLPGLSTAWSLAKRGHRVTIVEQGPIPNPLGASGDHHRIIRCAYGTAPGYGGASTEAYKAWNCERTLARITTTCAGSCVCRERGDEAEQYRDGLADGGYPFELLMPQRAVKRWPFLDAGTFRYAFLSPEGGACRWRVRASDPRPVLAADRPRFRI